MEDEEGRGKDIREGRQGELTPEFHLQGETGVMKGRWGREGRIVVSGQAKPMSQGPGACLPGHFQLPWYKGPAEVARAVDGEEEEPSCVRLKSFSVLLPWRMGNGGEF